MEGVEDRIQDLEAKLAAAEARLAEVETFAALVHQMPSSVQIVGMDGQTRYVNPAFERLSGVDLAFLRSINYDMRADEQLRKKGVLPYVLRAFAGEAGWVPAVDYYPEQEGFPGNRIFVEALVYPVLDDAKSQQGIAIIHRDVTERMEEEVARRTAELQEKERQLKEAQAIAHVGSWAWEIAEGRLTWTRELFRIYGVDPETFTPTFEAYQALIHPEDREKSREHILVASDDFAFTHRIIRPDGTVRVVEAQGRVHRGANGEPLRMTGTGQDITERVDQLERLLELDRMKDQFLGILSHELRTPLNAVLGFASVLEDEVVGPLNERQKQLTRRVLTGTDHLLELITDLLDMSRIRAGKFLLSPGPMALAPVAQSALESLVPLATAKEQRLILDAEPGLPSLHADEARVRQVLTNLVGNAIKFAAAPGDITVRAGRRDGMIHCEVADRGPGISREDQERLFQPFTQLDMTATRTAAGTGLGLSIAKALVEAHGGTIGVTSTVGDGATFWFTLPV
ncbi:MAG: domain S-box [Cyanobacteria bacterium RYN_339]|nr:domain S-box [Cyanobacteria bacterium RYN_339]